MPPASSSPDSPPPTTSPANQWSSHARQWSLLGSPLRPVAEDAQVAHAAILEWRAEHPDEAPRALLLGVTPELATMPWPAGTSLVAVDNSEIMIAAVLPKQGLPEGTRAVCADWRALPLDDGSIDVVVGDGCVSVFGFPEAVRGFAREVRRVMARGGRFVIRVFAVPDEREDLGTIKGDLRAGVIANFHCLKWRLAMAILGSPARGATLNDVYAACAELRPLLAELASRPGFEPEVVGTIEAYRDSPVTYSFPTVAQLREALADMFTLSACFTKSYALGERCPTLVLRPL